MSNNLIKVTRRYQFSSAHRLQNPNFSDAKNREVFAKCYNLHGHNFTLYITIEGPIDKETGMVINFTELKNLIKNNIINKVDHRYLNEDIAEFKETLPTAENMVEVFWLWLQDSFQGKPYILDEIKLYESDNNCITKSR
jgi:6-pyruvoyltetrahydropterin/6-carboxytetrahydropterin synthase